MRLELPLPPSVNSYWLHGNRRTYLSKNAVEFRAIVAVYLKLIDAEYLGNDRLVAVITFHFANKRTQDLDNRVKPLLDALQEANLFADDSQFDCLMIKRGEIIKNGKCIVMISKMGDNPDAISQIPF